MAARLMAAALVVAACAPVSRQVLRPTPAAPRCDAPPTDADRARALRALEGGCTCDARGVCAMALSPPSLLTGSPIPLSVGPAVLRELLGGAAPWLSDGGIIEALVCVGSARSPSRGLALAREITAVLTSLGADPSRLSAVAGPDSEEEGVRCDVSRIDGVALSRWDGARLAPVRTVEEGAAPCPGGATPGASSLKTSMHP